MTLTVRIDDQYHTFVIAEAGSNWKCGNYNEDLQRAKELIKIAANAGADAVKFQTFRSKNVYVPDAGRSKYLIEHGLNSNINDIFDNLSMPYEMIPELAESCKQENIMFMSTPFSVEDARHIDPYVQIHKIASYEINHVRLLEFLADAKKPILVSTGACTYTEIDFAVNTIRDKGNKMMGILQCTSKYPCPMDALNLFVIPQMKSRYNLPVGLSDHNMDSIIGPVLAVGLGATIIEKHFTINRNLPGPDHRFALIPSELELMVHSIRKADMAKGIGTKEVLKEELELRHFATRSIQAIRNISKGEVLREGFNFEVLRPGNRSRGLDARFLAEINGKKAKRDIECGEGIIEYE